MIYWCSTSLSKTSWNFFAETDTMILKFIWKVKGYLIVKTILKKGYQNWRTRTSSKCWASKVQVHHPTQKTIWINFVGPLVNNQRLKAPKQTPKQEKAMFNTVVFYSHLPQCFIVQPWWSLSWAAVAQFSVPSLKSEEKVKILYTNYCVYLF